jgi:hypothetical protein
MNVNLHPRPSASSIGMEDRDRILATLMEEWSPLQRDLMRRLLHGEDESMEAALEARPGTDAGELRRQLSLARARLCEAVRAWENES